MADARLQNTIDAAEQERSRWARELHDETLQALAVLRMRLDSALREDSSMELHEAARAAIKQLDAEIVKLRRLITELRPASLDAIGLEAALRALGEQYQASGVELDCHLELPPAPQNRPTDEVETTVYRLVQEALSNVSRHSKTQHADVAVRARGDVIEIEISDDGVGFEPSRVRQGFGLGRMQERAAMLGGTLRIDSAEGAGTRLRAEIPLTIRAGESGAR